MNPLVLSRFASSRLIGPVVSILAVVVALVISFALIGLNGQPPGEAARALFDGAFGSKKQAAATVARALPLALVALGWIVAFSARRINVGLEGQMIVGGITGTCIALYLPGVPIGLHLVLARRQRERLDAAYELHCVATIELGCSRTDEGARRPQQSLGEDSR